MTFSENSLKSFCKLHANHQVTIAVTVFTNKTTDLKQFEEVFPECQLNNLIIGRLKEIAEIESSIELGYVNYSTSGDNYKFNKYLLPVVLLRDLHDGNLALKDANVEQRMFAVEF